jgi:hypothetical protein
MSELQIYKVKDTADKHYTKMTNGLFNIPFRILIIGGTMGGKSNMTTNLILQPDMYNSYFEGDNIYIVSPSMENDEKLQHIKNAKDIPDENIFDMYDDEILMELYSHIEEQYNESIKNKEKVKNSLIIMDDCGFSGNLRAKNKGSAINKIFMNGRHINLSCIVCNQYYSQTAPAIRSNSNGIICFSLSMKQLKLIEDDHNYISTKKFQEIFSKATEEPHSFFIINYSMPKSQMYLDKNFKPINY